MRPRSESASIASKNPPARQPAKKDDAGSEMSAEPAQWKAHLETIEATAGRPHAHEPGARSEGEAATGEHEALPAEAAVRQ